MGFKDPDTLTLDKLKTLTADELLEKRFTFYGRAFSRIPLLVGNVDVFFGNLQSARMESEVRRLFYSMKNIGHPHHTFLFQF